MSNPSSQRSHESMRAALDQILAVACALTGTDRGYILLLSVNGESLDMFTWRGYAHGSPFIDHFRRQKLDSAHLGGQRHGKRLIVEDIENHPFINTADRQILLAENIRAFQSTPLTDAQGNVIGVLSNQFSEPHQPSEAELRSTDLLVKMAVDDIARHYADEELHRAAQLDSFRVRIADALWSLSDPSEIRAEAARMLGEWLGANRVVYFEVRGEAYFVERSFTCDADPLAGAYALFSLGDRPLTAYRSGRTVWSSDVATDEQLTPDERKAFAVLRIGAYIGVPFIKNDEFAAGLTVHSCVPRVWTAGEIALVEETARRTWSAVERARAGAATATIETRLQLALDAAEMGTFVWHPKDHQVELDERARALLGLTHHDALDSIKDLDELIPPEDRYRHAEALESALDPFGKGVLHSEHRVIRRDDGAERWIVTLGKTQFAGAPPTAVSISGVCADITRRKRDDTLQVEQRQLLERIATNRPLAECLTALTDAVPRLQRRVRAAVLLSNAERNAIADCQSANLQPAFGASIEGAPINDLAIGTCGTAIFKGEPVICSDIARADYWSQPWRELCLAHGIRACFSTPVLGPGGEAVASFFLCFAEAREPDEWERHIAEFGAHVASIAIERDYSRTVLRDSEARQGFLLKFSDALRSLIDPCAIQQKAVALLGEHIGANRICYGEINADDKHFVIKDEYLNDVSSMAGRYRLDDFGPALVTGVRNGHTLAVTHIAADPRIIDSERANYAAIDVAAYVAVPLIKRGRFAAFLSAQQSASRRWTSAEVQLIEEVAERTWAAVERARAEATLITSEEKYRTLFESIDEGVITFELIFDAHGKSTDYLHLESNPSFTRITGIQNIEGKLASEVMPDLGSDHFERFDRIVATGEAERYEYYNDDLGGQWFDVYLSQIRGEKSGKLVAVYSDITERKRREANLAFLAEVNQELASLTNIEETMNRLTEKIGGFFKATVCSFGEVDKEQEFVTVAYEWKCAESPSCTGAHRISDFHTEDFLRTCRIGQTYVVRNTATDVRVNAEQMAALSIHSLVSVPLLSGGVWRFNLSIFDSSTRDWRDDEIALISELASPIWARLEQARAEEALSQSEEKYRMLFTSIDEGFCMIEVLFDDAGEAFDYRFLETNPAFMRQTDLKNAVGRTIREFVPDIEVFWFQTYGHIAKTGNALRFEHEAAAMGKFYDVYAFRAGAPDEHHVAVFFNDVTERKRTETALRESEEQFANFMQRLPGLAWIKDTQGRYVYVNSAAERAFGVARAIIYGKTDDEIFPAETAAQFRANDRKAMTNTTGLVMVETLEQDDGVLHHSLVSKFPLRDSEGHVKGLGGVAIDITERVQAEQRLQDATQKLREADRRKDEFLATLAHELRNPLSPISNGLYILQMPGIDSEAIERIYAMMTRQVNHLIRLVDDLMEVSRITRGKIELRTEQVDLVDVLQNAVETSRPLIDAARQQIDICLPDEQLILNADKVRLAQVFANLLNNAAKYTPEAGKIWLSVRRDAFEVIVSVRDNGIGISSDMLPKVFDLFAQAGKSYSHSQGGMGIGLTLAKKLINMHGGSIQAYSDGIGKGSEFIVRLPLIHNDPDRDDAGDNPSETVASRRILVVDDNADAADSLSLLLTILGNETATVYDGQSALDILGTFKPDIIFLDIGMPEMDGFEVARRIRQLPEGRHITLIALTGWGQQVDRRMSREAGIQHHFVKPMDMATLKKLLMSLSARDRAGSE